MKKKLVLVCARAPVPPIGGERLKNLNLLRILSKYFDVHLIALNERSLEPNEVEELRKYTTTIEIFVKSKFQHLISVLNTVFNHKPLQVNYYYFADVQEAVNIAMKKADLLVCTLIRTAEYAESTGKPQFLDMADSIAQNYENAFHKTKNLFWKSIYLFEKSRLRRYEKECLLKFNKTFLFNLEEIRHFQMPDKLVWVPHGVSDKLFQLRETVEPRRNEISFLGKMDYQPNVDAAIWFATRVMPLLPSHFKFIVIGAQPTSDVINLQKADSRIEVTGFLDDPYARMKSSLCLVAPMQTGGGIQNKVLEAMAIGCPTVLSPLCARPMIDLRANDHAIICDRAEDYADAIQSLFANQKETQEMGRRGQEYVRSYFTWQAFEQVWIKTLSS